MLRVREKFSTSLVLGIGDCETIGCVGIRSFPFFFVGYRVCCVLSEA